MPSRVSERHTPITVEPERATQEDTSDPTVEQSLSELDEMRRTIQSLGLFARAKRRALIEQSEARETERLQSVELAWPRRTWQMSDSQFKTFAYAFRLAHEAANKPSGRSGR